MPEINSVAGLFFYGFFACVFINLVGWFMKGPQRPSYNDDDDDDSKKDENGNNKFRFHE